MDVSNYPEWYSQLLTYPSNQKGYKLHKSTSGEYDSDWGLVTVGTRVDIHPNAWSGSLTDADNLKFIYKSGKSTGGR